MLSDIEAHYQDLIKRSEITGELCLTWFQSSTASKAISVLHPGAQAAATSGNFSDLIDKAVQEQLEGGFGGFLLLGEAAPWFLAIEYTGDRAYKALEQLSSEGKALCLLGSQTLQRFSLHYSLAGRRACRFKYGDAEWGETAALEEQLQGLFHLHERYADVATGRVSEEGLLEDWRVHALILAERITGLRLSFEWLGRAHTLYRF